MRRLIRKLFAPTATIRKAPPVKTSLGLTALETREVPTVASLTNGILTVTGTDNAETITVRQSTTSITVDGVAGSFAVGSVSQIKVNALGGNDTVRLNQSGAVVTKTTVVWGGSGNDTVYGGNGADYLDGGVGNDVLFGFDGVDALAGDDGDDYLYGGESNDDLAGGDGKDFLQGEGGNDVMDGGLHDDIFNGGSGTDHAYDDLFGTTILDSGVTHHHFFGVGERSEFGWFDMNMNDSDLRLNARTAHRGGSISRSEMIQILERATDGTSVTSTEFGDLSRLVNADEVSMSGIARNLSQKVVNGDPANAWWTGGGSTRQSLGNLYGGADDDHLQRLVDKWFKGADRPMAKNYARTTTFGYEEAAGSLFVGGPSSADLKQGNLGDCYYLAGLGAVADQDAWRITGMFTDNGDGTYTVRFYKNGQPEYVTVDRFLPVNGSGNFVFANSGASASSATNELWVALAEKAYAQLNESGWTGQDGTNSYNGIGGALPANATNSGGINGGWSATAMAQITPASTSTGLTGLTSFADVRAAFDAGKAVTFSTPDSPPNSDVVGNHVYVMVGYNAATQTITLRNPWGAGASKPELITLTFSQVQANFDIWDVANI